MGLLEKYLHVHDQSLTLVIDPEDGSSMYLEASETLSTLTWQRNRRAKSISRILFRTETQYLITLICVLMSCVATQR
jgi:hypothetical protein